MKKVALIFVIAVLAPSLVLAWLALRSLRDQELVLERQQELLFQGTTDRVAEKIRAAMNEMQNEFGERVESLTQDTSPRELAPRFDEKIRADWPLLQVGFCVTLDGSVLAPSLLGDRDAKSFREDNELFLSNRAPVEVYQNSQVASIVPAKERNARVSEKKETESRYAAPVEEETPLAKAAAPNQAAVDQQLAESPTQRQRMIARNVSPLKEPRTNESQQLSSVVPSDAEFRQIVGEAASGVVARFLQNKLSLMVWHRAARDPQLIFGGQFQLDRLKEKLAASLQLDPDYTTGLGLALLDDAGKPAARSANFSSNWKRPFVATEVGEVLPHWEVAAYLLDPGVIDRGARNLRQTIGWMIAVMLVAICAGGAVLVADIRRELMRARQKTDFVSNVSHELKTPLTSIRMFSELLAEGRVESPEKQTHYSQIIAAEASRLTRLINNVLDFARMERGEKKYDRQTARLDVVVEETLARYRPPLEANGFSISCQTEPLTAEVDRDAIAQAFLNLLSNAEKYGGEAKEISVTVQRRQDRGEICVCDRGLGVPRAAAAKIFEQFHRAHDSLNSGIQGAGLGLTLARQIARGHGGEVTFAPRGDGGSCFTISIPIS